MSNTSVMTKHLPTEGSTAAAEAIDAALISTTKSTNSGGGARSPIYQTPDRHDHKQTQIKVPDSGYGSTIDSPELSQENTTIVLLKGKAKDIKKCLFPREKKVLKQYSRTLTPIEQARFADLRILFGYALSELLLSQKKSFAAIEMRVAVMGETETSARPIILVACQKPIIKTVRQFFAQKEIKDELTPSNKIWPKFEVLVREQLALFSGDGLITVWMADTTLDEEDQCNPYGKPILIKMEENSKVATLGGILWTRNSSGQVHCYGLTVGHIQPALLDSSEECTAELMDSSPGDVQSETCLATHDQCQDVVEDTIEAVGLSDPFSSDDDDDYEIDGWQTPQTPQFDVQEHERPASFDQYVGEVVVNTFADSKRLNSGNKDWALIELSPKFWKDTRNNLQVTALQSTPSLVNVAKEDSITAGQLKDVTVARAGMGGIRGELSKQESTIMFGPENTFVDLYTLSGLAAQALKAGDSGAWVYDSQTLEVYGHIIGKGLFGDVLVMPMHAIVRDIQQSLGASDVWLHHTHAGQGAGADSYHYDSLSTIPPVRSPIFPSTSTPTSGMKYSFDMPWLESNLAIGGSDSLLFPENFNTPGTFSSVTNPFTSGQVSYREVGRFGQPIRMESSHSMNTIIPLLSDIQDIDSAYCSPEVTPSNSETSTPQGTPLKRLRSSESSPVIKRVCR